jgi:hypothetical protein
MHSGFFAKLRHGMYGLHMGIWGSLLRFPSIKPIALKSNIILLTNQLSVLDQGFPLFLTEH